MNQQWPADKVERRSVDSLLPYAKNSRTHDDAQIAAIAASIKEWGWTVPVLVDTSGTLIAGHGRILAARKLGIKEVPTMVADGWTDAQRRAYVIADNKLTLRGGWDTDLLALELGDLKDDGFNIDLIGFDESELDALFKEPETETEGNTDPDEVPEPEPDPITVSGDIWVLGRHRIMCGDSTNPEHISRLMQDKQADLCFTSPPYAQQRDYKSGGISDWDALMQGVFSILPVKYEAQVLVNLGMVHRDGEWMPYWDAWVEWMRNAGWRRFGWYVWDQGPGLPGDWNGRLAPSHEFIFHFNRVAEKARKTKASKMAGKPVGGQGLRGKDGTVTRKTNEGEVYQSTKIPDSVVRIMRHKGGLGDAGSHPAPFPVDLVSEMLTAFSDPDDLVFEPFIGSGTQLISAQKNGRSCYGMELAPVYTDVAVRRWQNFSGQFAVHESTGRTFNEIAEDRQSAMAEAE